MTRPAPDIVARVERLLGWTPENWRPVQGGYTPAARCAVASGGLAPIRMAPFVRRVQLEQLSTALPWAIRALGLGNPGTPA